MWFHNNVILMKDNMAKREGGETKNVLMLLHKRQSNSFL